MRFLTRRWRARAAVFFATLALVSTAVAPASADTLFRTDLSLDITSFSVSGRTVNMNMVVRNNGPASLTDVYHLSFFTNIADYTIAAPGRCAVDNLTGQFVDCQQPGIQQVGGSQQFAVTLTYRQNCGNGCVTDIFLSDLRFRQKVDLDESNDSWQIRQGRALVRCDDPPSFACLNN